MDRIPDTSSFPERAQHRRAGIRLGDVMWFAGLVVAALTFVVIGFVLGRTVFAAMGGGMRTERGMPVRVASSVPAAAALAATGSVSGGMIEVPELRRTRADEAVVVLETAGFAVRLVEVGEPVSKLESRTVIAQDPAAGTVASADSTVTLTVPPLSANASASVVATGKARKKQYVVCIDPGHQAHTDRKVEPIGPGSKIEKPWATGGATGIVTGVPEYEIALQLSMNLKNRLEAAGVKVIMTRTTNDIRLSNASRAKIANKAHANLFIRIHGGASTNPADSGIRTLYPDTNQWTRKIVERSRVAARVIEQSVCRATNAAVLGTKTEAGMAGFNWSKVATVLVETGYLSNPVEDRLLASPTYQDKVAQGISDGVVQYLQRNGD